MAGGKKRNSFAPLFFRLKNLPWRGIFNVLIGIFFLVAAVRSWLDGYASLRWKTTPGKVTTSKSVICTHYRYFSAHEQAIIIYTYSVGGVSYSSGQMALTFDQLLGYGCGDAEAVKKEYPFGKPVTVYYNPQNPKESVLFPGGTSFVFSGLSLFFGLWGASDLIKGINARRKIVKRGHQGRIAEGR